ncbi:TIGR01244 family phosphatase [Sphingosinicellaceae bacterium]|nr:TIGR01244 family phosphatase [Sphingosinicellaceae bacterium]
MFINLTENIAVAGQIAPADLITAAAQGFVAVVNNRPDGEEAGQPTSATMREAALAAGLRYDAIPIDQSGLSMPQVEAMAAVLDAAGEGRVLAWCRSGTRSTHLWALAEASRGGDPDVIVAAAATGRYDVSGLLPTLRKLSGQ